MYPGGSNPLLQYEVSQQIEQVPVKAKNSIFNLSELGCISEFTGVEDLKSSNYCCSDIWLKWITVEFVNKNFNNDLYSSAGSNTALY